MPRLTQRTTGSADPIYERLLAAIVEHRLQPGTKLVEEKLGEVFAVSRTRIRQALFRLAHEKVITLLPNRGAYVARPSIAEAREVFAVRRLIEPMLAKQLAQAADPAQLRRLRECVAQETRARSANDRRGMIKLSGEFHIQMAQMAGNAILARILRELVARTSLVLVLYEPLVTRGCLANEHAALIDAIEARDARTAARLMLRHLQHVEDNLDLRDTGSDGVDLKSVFAEAVA